MAPIPTQLIALIHQRSSQPTPLGVQALTYQLLQHYGHAVQAILFYGSCFRTGDDTAGLADLYVLVDNYDSAYLHRSHAFFNKLLPPNVFHLDVSLEGRKARAKYAVLSVTDFQRGTSSRWFHSYLWGRFAQPAGLLYACNEGVARQVYRALAQAVVTFIARVLPLVRSPFTARELWRQGLLHSYRAELRAERRDELVHLFDAEPEYYEQLTLAAMAVVPFSVEASGSVDPISYQAQIPARTRHYARLAWMVRCLQGKLLSVLRLLKGFFTFREGPEYILWKIRRHSGVTVELTPRQRRYPLLAACLLFWRLYRRGGFR